jgi:hypothetical protein
MEITIHNKKYKLLRNLAYCKNCQIVYESAFDWLIVECGCNTCFVSGGIGPKSRIYGANAVNVSEWLDLETGKKIPNNMMYQLRKS